MIEVELSNNAVIRIGTTNDSKIMTFVATDGRVLPNLSHQLLFPKEDLDKVINALRTED